MAISSAFASVPPPSSTSHQRININPSSTILRYPSFSFIDCNNSKSIDLFICSSSSSSSPVVEKGGGNDPPPADNEGISDTQSQSSAPTFNPDDVPVGGCKACGKQEIERGCNGEGRIQGGIATVPGFGWWPIKAYRPCPEYVASGGRYRRRGQSMDEVVSGGASREP